MTARVVQLEAFRVARAAQAGTSDAPLPGCSHQRLTLNDDGEFVSCDDCHGRVDNYEALRLLVAHWSRLQAQITADLLRIAEAESVAIEMRAAQRVERAWRSRSMAPTCPHCCEAILPTDGFGGAMVSRAIAARRRALQPERHEAFRLDGAQGGSPHAEL